MFSKRILLNFFIALLSAYGNAGNTDKNELDWFFVRIKHLEFSDLESELSSRPNSDFIDELKYLNSLIAANETKELNSSMPESVSETSKNAIHQLILGYEHLFAKRDRISAFNYFSKGLNTAIEGTYDEISKACLIGLFKVMVQGYSVPDENFVEYLRLYEERISDDIDKFWFHFYAIALFDLTTNYHDNKHEKEEVYLIHLDALTQLQSKLDDRRILFFINKLNGDYYVKIDGAKALEYYQKCNLQIPNESYYDKYRFRVKLNVARGLSKIGEQKSAIQFLHQAKTLLTEGNEITNNLNYYFFLSEFHNKNKDYDSSNVYLRKLFALEKQTAYVETNRQISELEVALETEKKEKQILEEQQKAKAIQNWLIAAGIVLLFGAGIAILLQKNTTKRRLLAEQESILRQQRVDNLLKEQELISIDAMIAGQEKERQKVANELHDDLGSLMATIKLHFDNARVNRKDPALQNAQKLIEEAYQKIRSMAHSKNSGVMSDHGLLPAIKKMAKTISATNVVQVKVEDFGLGERLENTLELTIFRIVQELVANALKHAVAKNINIQLTQHQDNLNIIVEDDGRGFDSNGANNKNNGMGLTTIEKRIEHLEGSFTIDSIIGKGTSILIDIPL
ncbi:sensor histidine kinase [Muricauda sp. 2012CJ35-5]|uniref:Oxygen sensor histidine kinase NreB n=1 Tax=Flagellimonas spongiicola TaxID=2942208 RepID=A0ABT0PNH1_9FLAO|nr:sensor histidine kinase [Allomuricauda spongiicola]MCL6272516.1 sensor histidine kinase [Allomuricauda spongiicola]